MPLTLAQAMKRRQAVKLPPIPNEEGEFDGYTGGQLPNGVPGFSDEDVRDRPIEEYREGGEGFIRWVEDKVWCPIYPPGEVIPVWYPMHSLPEEKNPETGRSYRDMWEGQKEELRRALEMKDGRFLYTVIVLCWPRGEGKSLVVCWIQLWKFFCWPRQQIMLGANSKEQTKFVHFDIMRECVRNSPQLFEAVGGNKNVQEKEIRLVDATGATVSVIRSVSSFTGIYSNITGYTFSEMFDMKNPKFFVQIDGSIRNIPNALGTIDSTVSDKKHVLYQLYSNFKDGKTKKVYFSYRCALRGESEEYWNPNMTTDQLNDYRAKFPFGEFEKYFLNLWSAGGFRVFKPWVVEATKYLGINGKIGNFGHIVELLKLVHEKEERVDELIGKRQDSDPEVAVLIRQTAELRGKLLPVEGVYKLEYNAPAPVEVLRTLGDMFDTGWAILTGTDMADPMAKHPSARTIFQCIAKGLPGSRSNPSLDMDNPAAPYIYVLLYIKHLPKSTVDEVKECVEECIQRYDGVDTFSSERYGSWDMVKWCEEREIAFDPVFPNYARQHDAFKELFTVYNTGRFLTPPVPIPGSKELDIHVEEFLMFDHDVDAKWFGSPEKTENRGIQDDVCFCEAWTVWGGRNVRSEDFRDRGGFTFWGTMIPPERTVAAY